MRPSGALSDRFDYAPIPCPVCRGERRENDRTHRIVRRSWMPILKDVLDRPVTVVRCLDCGHHYVSPAPTDDSFKRYYVGDYFLGDESAPENIKLRLSMADRFFFATCRMPPLPSGRLLDVGAGNRKYLLWARQRGYDVHGFDSAPFPAVEGAQTIPMAYGELRAAGFSSQFFDVITAFWVLEHLKDPARLVCACRDLLRPGGYLVVGVPNAGSPEARRWGDYWHHLLMPEHISQFDRDSLRRLLETCGLEVTRVRLDLLSFDTLLSLWDIFYYRWGVRLPFHNHVARALSLPFEPLRVAFNLSGNMTAFARKR